MLWKRVLSAVVLIPLLLLAVWQGNIWFLLVTALLMVIGLLEIHALLKKLQFNPSLVLLILSGLLFLLAAYFNKVNENFTLITTMIILVNLAMVVFEYPKYKVLDAAATIFGTFYLAFLLVHFYLIRQLDKGFHFMLLMLFATWATDTFAYFVGMSMGKHRLAPALSPKKSIEGAIGGILGALITGLVFAGVSPQTSLYHYIIIALIIGVTSQIGDLAESAFKRTAGVKDSGNLIPGHGGFLDRFDSILFAAPLVYYYVKLFILI